MLIACRPGPRMGTLGLAVVAQSNLIAASTGKTGCVMITEGILPKTSCHFIHVKVCSWLLSCICIYLCIFWLNAGPLSLPWLSAEKCELSVAELSVLYW